MLILKIVDILVTLSKEDKADRFVVLHSSSVVFDRYSLFIFLSIICFSFQSSGPGPWV